jgi:hypothetical protein
LDAAMCNISIVVMVGPAHCGWGDFDHLLCKVKNTFYTYIDI